MTKAPKKPDSRAKALAGMTKAELVKTVKALDRRQTVLLNQLAFEKEKLEACQAVSATYARMLQDDVPTPDDINSDSLVTIEAPSQPGPDDWRPSAPSQFFPWSTNQEPK